jgi:hypothetical protein
LITFIVYSIGIFMETQRGCTKVKNDFYEIVSVYSALNSKHFGK